MDSVVYIVTSYGYCRANDNDVIYSIYPFNNQATLTQANTPIETHIYSLIAITKKIKVSIISTLIFFLCYATQGRIQDFELGGEFL